MNVVVCVKQIPDPAEPGALEPRQHAEARRQAHPRRVRLATASRWPSSWSTRPAAARSPSSRWPPTARPSGLRTALAMGAAKAILVSDDALAGRRRPRHRQGAGRRHQAGRARPRPRRHRVDRRLHRHRARADRRAPRPARRSPSPSTSRSPTARSRSQRQTEAGYDEVECPLPAVVSVTAGVVEPRYPSLQGDHGGQVQAGRRGHGRRPRPRRRPGRLGRRRPGDRRRRPPPRSARPARSSRTTARASTKIVAFLESLKVI